MILQLIGVISCLCDLRLARHEPFQSFLLPFRSERHEQGILILCGCPEHQICKSIHTNAVILAVRNNKQIDSTASAVGCHTPYPDFWQTVRMRCLLFAPCSLPCLVLFWHSRVGRQKLHPTSTLEDHTRPPLLKGSLLTAG